MPEQEMISEENPPLVGWLYSGKHRFADEEGNLGEAEVVYVRVTRVYSKVVQCKLRDGKGGHFDQGSVAIDMKAFQEFVKIKPITNKASEADAAKKESDAKAAAAK